MILHEFTFTTHSTGRDSDL